MADDQSAPTIAYHFEKVHDAASTEDGKHIVLTVTGGAGHCGLSIPIKEVPSAMTLMFTAAAEAVRRSGDKTLMSAAIRELRVYSDMTRTTGPVLAITVHSGAPPLAFSISQQHLEEFALGVLQTAGRLPPESPAKQ